MNSNTKQQPARSSSRGALIILLIITALAALFFWQRILIIDSVLAWRYQPTPDIARITSTVGFSTGGERIFYASSPVLDGTSAFNAECTNTEKTSVVLGCYQSGKIYLYQIDNDELAGVEEVTAAHEMLHAAYDRLSTSEQKRVNGLLETEATKLLQDRAFKERMSVYDKLPAADRINELHSVVGTEIALISKDLERYYQQYFHDRANIVALYNQYHSLLADLQQEAKQLGASIDAQAVSINKRVEAYNQAAVELETAIKDFNRKARSGYFTTQTEFAIARAELVDQSAALESERVGINQAIATYEADKERFDGLSSHLTELTNSIDSSLAPAPNVSEDQ